MNSHGLLSAVEANPWNDWIYIISSHEEA